MISPRSSHSSRGFSLCFTFCSGPVFYNSELSHLVVASARFLRCSSESSSRPSIHNSLESFAPLPCELLPSSGVSLSPVCVSLLPRRVLPTYLVPSVKRKLRSAGPCGTSDWQPMFPFMGMVGDSTTGPFFIDWFPFLGIWRRLVILIKGDLGLFDIWTLLYNFHILPLLISWQVLSRLHPCSQLLETQQWYIYIFLMH